MAIVNFYGLKSRTPALSGSNSGFTMVEALVALAVIGIGVASTLGALTKFNSMAAISRNSTGATALMVNQVDLFQSMSPFNPQPSKNQIPIDSGNNPPTYDMTVGTHVLGYKDPTTGVLSTLSDPWPVYREPARWTYADNAARVGAIGFTTEDVGQLAYQSDTQTFWRLQATAPTWVQDLAGGTIVRGTLSCTVTDISDTTKSPPIYRYQGDFTLAYQYLGRGPIWSAARNRWEYQVKMTAIRSSDI